MSEEETPDTGDETMTKARFTVRKQSSGYTYSVKYYVYDTVSKGRVSVHAMLTRDAAQASADALNISDMVKPHAEDPRPYDVRHAEATAAYESARPEGVR